MEKIKIGEYVRTKKGIIAKVQAYQELKIYDDGDKQAIFISYETDRGAIADIEIKHIAKDIIDLIEVGDYVNGLYIHGIYDNGLEVYRYGDWHDILYTDEIKSILTKEQFANAEYRLED